MPSRSRKKNKGQARKAKAAAELQRWVANPNDSICNHGQAKDTPEVCVQFIASFFQSFNAFMKAKTSVAGAAKFGLNQSYSKFPDAVNDENHLDIVKKIFISCGVNSILGIKGTQIASLTHACGIAAALMGIDSYNPSYPVPQGEILRLI